ncbi:hypothetical protein M569_00062 [Genlisea aurea]|uniref:Uncharacterized protein n=1 Tax=Genlisea aurea TaxID=192259 RepID=S8EP59_9LAMI|nr:hypothetical protein M569_00062 [Genlisea aurea]
MVSGTQKKVHKICKLKTLFRTSALCAETDQQNKGNLTDAGTYMGNFSASAHYFTYIIGALNLHYAAAKSLSAHGNGCETSHNWEWVVDTGVIAVQQLVPFYQPYTRYIYKSSSPHQVVYQLCVLPLGSVSRASFFLSCVYHSGYPGLPPEARCERFLTMPDAVLLTNIALLSVISAIINCTPRCLWLHTVFHECQLTLSKSGYFTLQILNQRAIRLAKLIFQSQPQIPSRSSKWKGSGKLPSEKPIFTLAPSASFIECDHGIKLSPRKTLVTCCVPRFSEVWRKYGSLFPPPIRLRLGLKGVVRIAESRRTVYIESGIVDTACEPIPPIIALIQVVLPILASTSSAALRVAHFRHEVGNGIAPYSLSALWQEVSVRPLH